MYYSNTYIYVAPAATYIRAFESPSYIGGSGVAWDVWPDIPKTWPHYLLNQSPSTAEPVAF
jgi:hypothetical protein